jgi:putative hydrolase of the HAD superfamily
MPVHAVVFDLFGTLIDDSSPAAYREFLDETARRLGADPSRFGELWAAHDVVRYTGPIEACFDSICAELGVSDRARLEAALAFRVEYLRRILVPRPDAETTLRTLRRRGLRLGMISNASGEVSGLWAETPLAPLFDAVSFSADERLMKPDRRLYEQMAEELGVAPEECLFVGDGAYRELQGAAAVGMTPVLIRVPHDPWEHEGTIGWEGPRVSALSEVLALV